MKTNGLRKTLILVTRVTKDSRDYEYTNDWKSGSFKCCEQIKIDGSIIRYFKANSQNRHLIVLSGDGLSINPYSGQTDQQVTVFDILKFYNDNLDILTVRYGLTKVVEEINTSEKTLVALHWNSRLLIGDSNTTFQNFANAESLHRRLKERGLTRFKNLFARIGYPAYPAHSEEQNKFIRNLPERLKFPNNCQYTDYTIGGDRSILPQVREMVNSLENNLAGFDKSFDDLWVGIKGSYTILHMVSILLGYLKVQLYDAGQSPQDIKDKEKIIRSIKYLCTGEQSDNILQEAEKLLPRSEENLKDWILSDFEWGEEANKTLEEYLANLPSYLENYKSDNFITFCSEFRNFIQDISIGKKPEKIDVD